MLGVGSAIIRWLDRKEEKAVAEAKIVSFEEGHAKGHAEGRTGMAAEFKDWLARKKATEARGEEFGEPMPEPTDTEQSRQSTR